MSDEREWMSRAECRGTDTAVFFPDGGDVPTEAMALCGECDVRPDCLAYALSLGEDAHGVWAGTSERARRRMRSASGMSRQRQGERSEAYKEAAGW